MRYIFPGRIRLDGRAFAACAVLLAVLAVPVKAQENWKTFANAQYSIRYPGNWFLRYHFRDVMDVVDIPGPGLNATGIGTGQAAIGVRVMEPGNDFEDTITRWSGDSTLLSRETVTAGKGSCEKLEHLVTRFEFVSKEKAPKGYDPVIDDEFYCLIASKTYLIRAQYWTSDTRKNEFQALAREMAATLRPLP